MNTTNEYGKVAPIFTSSGKAAHEFRRAVTTSTPPAHQPYPSDSLSGAGSVASSSTTSTPSNAAQAPAK